MSQQRDKINPGNYFESPENALFLPAVGKRTYILWAGNVNIRNASYEPLPSSFGEFDSEERSARVNAKIKEIESKGGFDGPKWRVEKIIGSHGQTLSYKSQKWHTEEERLVTFASPTSYFPHAVLRNDKDKNGKFLPILAYPHPETINVILRTKDDYLVIGNRLSLEKGGTSDQEGLCLMPSGFVDRDKGNIKPSLEMTLLKESEELGFSNGYNFVKEYSPENARVIAAVTGSNTDSTKVILYDIDVKSGNITTPKKLGEHGNLLFLPNDPIEIESVVENGKYCGIVAPDHMLGGLAVYADLKMGGAVD